MNYKSVLIISHTCFSDTDSMGSTLASYFSEYPIEKVAQFYIKDMQPNVPFCKNFFCVTDKDVLHGLIKPWRKPIGRAFTIFDLDDNKEKKTFAEVDSYAKYCNRHRNLLIRNLVWSTKIWYNQKLKNWIDEIKPELILVQPGDFAYLLDMAVLLSKKLNVPLFVHQSESYYLKAYESNNLFYRIYRRDFKRAYEKLMKNTKAVIYLCDALKRDYDKYFSCKSYTIMKSTQIEPKKKNDKETSDTYKFIYAGNLGEKVGRAEPLLKMGIAIKELGYHIDVFSASEGEHLKELTIENGIKMHSAVSYDLLQQKIKESDFVLHMENQNEENIIDLQYAFSTKIADMLASGCCPIIFGSERIASIKYFKDTNTGLVIENECDLYSKIKEVIENKSLRESYIENALNQAKKYHNPEVNAELFAEILVKG